MINLLAAMTNLMANVSMSLRCRDLDCPCCNREREGNPNV
jgi:hypothetical protein